MAVKPEARIRGAVEAAGCEVNGSNSWDPQVHDNDAFERIAKGGLMAVGETYVDGLWDCEQLDVLSERLGALDSPIKYFGKRTLARAAVAGAVQNLQSRRRARQNAEHHYNIGNDLYESMLGETMAYSCAYWEDGAENLDEAQRAKLDLVCRKLGLEEGMRVLDIGAGWGSFVRYATDEYGVDAVGVTPASEQAAYIEERNPDIEVRQVDWRELEGETFDRVLSIGMFEHVGPRNYREYFEKVRQLTAPDGLSFLHTIGAPRTRLVADPWTTKYIFPGGHIPSRAQIEKASEAQLVIADWHEIGPNYDPTLMAWYDNFRATWPDLSQIRKPDGSRQYDEKFDRMWTYYLKICAGSFRNGSNQLFQVVMASPEMAEEYQIVR